jgi:hypothetical protein
VATVTLAGTGERYPSGTTVAAYPEAAALADRAPSGSAVSTATAGSSTVALSGLANSTRYVAYALVAGQHRYTHFSTDAVPAVAGATAGLLTFDQPGTLRLGTGLSSLRFPVAVRLLSVAATAGRAPTGAAILVDVNLNGITIFTGQAGRPQIAAGATASSDAQPDVTSVSAGDSLTCDIDQVGSSFAGSDLTVIVRYVEV